MITIIIPTYNEKKNIKKIINQITSLGIPSLNILVVDDNSPDNTSNIVKIMQKNNKNLHLLINKEKKGLGKAYIIGMNYSINKLKADILVEIDADLSHDPKILPEMLKFIPEYDLVLGSRYIKDGSIPKKWEFHRKFLSFFGNFIFRVFFSWKVKDWTTGYRVIKKEVYKKIKEYIDNKIFYDYTFQVVFLHQAMKRGFKIKEYPIEFKERKKGKSKFKGLNYIKNNILYIIKAKLNKK
jgi:dolichol-phosphate mannosyltransferase